MKRIRLASLAAASALAFVLPAACAKRASGPPVPKPNTRITILGVNDFHGAIEERRVMLKTSAGTTAEVRVGGAALLAAYVRKLRASNPEGTVLLSGGDMWQGSLESNWFEGRPVVLLDNALGYDAAALGNHEFDYGPVGASSLAIPSDPPDVRYGALNARRKEAKFPLLAANVRATEPGVPEFPAMTFIERKGLKIAIIGLSTEDTPNTTQRPNVAGYAFDPPGPALERAAKEARAAGADLVLVAAHVGGECKRNTAPDDPTACAPGKEVQAALAGKPPVDAFVAGHTHQYMSHFVNNIPVIESGSFGQAVGRIDIEWDVVGKKIAKTTIHPPIAVCRDVLEDTGTCLFPTPGQNPRPRVVPAALLGGPVLPDPEIERTLAPFRQEVAELKKEVLGTAERPLGVARYEPSELGALVTDEMRAATRRLPDVPDADFAVQNAGGIRTTLPAGKITYGALYEVLPFDNYLATITVSGTQLDDLLTAVARTGRVLQTSGLRVEMCGEGAKSEVSLYSLETGKPLDPKKNYVVVWNDFLANGGDGTKEALTGVPNVVHGHLLRDVVADGLRARKGKPLNAEADPLLDPTKPRLKRCAR